MVELSGSCEGFAAVQDMGQGLAVKAAPPAPLVLVAIADGAIEWDAVELIPMDERPVSKVPARHKVVAGFPL